MNEADLRKYACRTCGAQPGYPCMDYKGRTPVKSHVPRMCLENDQWMADHGVSDWPGSYCRRTSLRVGSLCEAEKTE